MDRPHDMHEGLIFRGFGVSSKLRGDVLSIILSQLRLGNIPTLIGLRLFALQRVGSPCSCACWRGEPELPASPFLRISGCFSLGIAVLLVRPRST